MSDDPEFVYAPVHVAVVTDDPDDPDVGIHDTLTPVCDFCFDSRIRWQYPCEDFFIAEMQWGSTEWWASCDRCSELIEAGDVDGLAERSIKSWEHRHGRVNLFQEVSIKRIQQGYWEHQNGDRVPFG